MYMACRLLPRVPYLWGFKAPDCMHADCCQVYRVYACTLTVDYCHLYSTAVVLIFSWCIEKEEVLKRQMLILPALVRTLISHPEKKRLSVSLIIYCGCQSIFDMERHCILALSKIIWSTALGAWLMSFTRSSSWPMDSIFLWCSNRWHTYWNGLGIIQSGGLCARTGEIQKML